MANEYQDYYAKIIEAKNPNLKEFLIYCSCGERYRVFIDSNIGQLDTAAVGVCCPHCQVSIGQRRGYSTHSGGCFNALVILIGE